jgi:acyl carrier protein
MTTTPLPSLAFHSKTDTEIEQSLLGLDPVTIDAVLRFRHTPARETLRDMLPGLVAYHLPRGAALPPSPLTDAMRLAEDLGLDSLALSEMTFKLEEILGFAAETREVFEIRTVGALIDFLSGKLSLS